MQRVVFQFRHYVRNSVNNTRQYVADGTIIPLIFEYSIPVGAIIGSVYSGHRAHHRGEEKLVASVLAGGVAGAVLAPLSLIVIPFASLFIVPIIATQYIFNG